MPKPFTRELFTLDASGKSLGRVATEVARYLQGKHRVDWSPNTDCGSKVIVKNLSQARFTGTKETGKRYYRHTNYPGNMKITLLKDMWRKRPQGVFENVISRMLPKNKLRKEMLKRLTIEL